MLPKEVTLVEVGPRDGLQNETSVLTVAARVQLIQQLAQTGLRVIEAGSFVSAKWVPQMADTDQVVSALKDLPQVRLPVLVPNLKGLECAMAAGCTEIAVFAAASESFSQKNINASIAESLARYTEVIEKALAAKMRVRGYVSCALGCPFEGPIAPQAVSSVAKQLFDLGCFEISLGDTIGVGTPEQAKIMLATVAEQVPIAQLAVHFHDTYGQALANIYSCLMLGVRTIDSAIGGLGGCPYAPGASGNVATEEVVYLLNGLGIQTGVDLAALVSVSQNITKQLNRRNRSKVTQALGAKS